MTTRIHLPLAVLAAALTLAVSTGAASANQLSISEQDIRAVFPEMKFSAVGGGFEVICQVIVEGTFHEDTFSKVQGTLVGLVTEAQVTEEGCAGAGTAAVVQESLPWHITYAGYLGTLPNMTSIELELHGVRFAIQNIFELCTYEGTLLLELIRGMVSTTMQPEPAQTIPLVEGTFCPEAGTLEGTAPVTVLAEIGNVLVILI